MSRCLGMSVKPGLSGDNPMEKPPIGGPLEGGLPGSPGKNKVPRRVERRGGEMGSCGIVEECDELSALGLVGVGATSTVAKGSDWVLERNTDPEGDGDETTLRWGCGCPSKDGDR